MEDNIKDQQPGDISSLEASVGCAVLLLMAVGVVSIGGCAIKGVNALFDKATNETKPVPVMATSKTNQTAKVFLAK